MNFNVHLGYCLIIFMILLYLTSLYVRYDLSSFAKTDLNTVKLIHEYFHTGDVIMFQSCYHCRRKSSKTTIWLILNTIMGFPLEQLLFAGTQTNFNHCAIIIRINRIPYLLHIDGLNTNLDFRGVDMVNRVSLETIDSLNNCNGSCILFKYSGNKSWSDDCLIEIINNLYKKKIIYPHVLSLLKSNFLKFNKPSNIKCCVDLVINVLYKLKISKKDNNNSVIMDLINILGSGLYNKGHYISNSCRITCYSS